jgi:hypothetical protein
MYLLKSGTCITEEPMYLLTFGTCITEEPMYLHIIY